MTGGIIWAAKTRANHVSPPVVQQRQRSFGAQLPPAVGQHQFDRIGIRSQGQSQRRRSLPKRFQEALEHISGIPMGDVQVHYGSSKPNTVDAHAYTQGNQIHLAPGQEHHLAHEAWHVVQQKQHRVRPTIRVANQPVNDNDGLEREADRMAARIRSFSSPAANPVLAANHASTATAPVAQRAARHKPSRRRAQFTRARQRKNLEFSPKLHHKLVLPGKRNRKGVARYGRGDGTRTGIGAYAVSGVPTKRVNRNFTEHERNQIRRLGKKYGCHQCGSKNEAHFVPDHQPPLSQTNLASYNGALYPHCRKCSSLQGGLLASGKK